MKRLKNNQGCTLTGYSLEANTIGLVLDLLEYEEVKNASEKLFKRIIDQTSGLHFVAISNDGVRACVKSLLDLRELIENNDSLDELINFFKFAEKEKDKALYFVDPIGTPAEIFNRFFNITQNTKENSSVT